MSFMERCAGLDARAAVIVMHAIKIISKGGRTILVTIHQPSIGNSLYMNGVAYITPQSFAATTAYGSLDGLQRSSRPLTPLSCCKPGAG
jgi:ABC-type multidrug transport system ATPase subunit